MKFEEYFITYKNHLGNEQIIGTFWINTLTGEIDQNNLPSDKEVSQLLKALMNNQVAVESTGVTIDGSED